MEKGPAQAPSAQYGQAQPPAYQQPYPAGHTAYNVQPVTSVTVVRRQPNNHLVFAIFVTLCCCLPFGIIGIVYSVDSSNKFNIGDDVGATNSANLARKWSMAGLACGSIIVVIIIVLQVTELSTTTTYTSYN